MLQVKLFRVSCFIIYFLIICCFETSSATEPPADNDDVSGETVEEPPADDGTIESAILHNNLARLRQLLASNQNLAYMRVTPKNSNSATTPLHLAVEQNNFLFASILIDNGADIDATNQEFGATALQWAVLRNVDTSFVNLLLEKAKERVSLVSRRDLLGRTALGIAIANSNIELVRLLLSYRSNPNLPDISGCNSPLINNVKLESQMCSDEGSILTKIDVLCPNQFIAKSLVDFGANVNAIDRCSGENAIQRAKNFYKVGMAQLLSTLATATIRPPITTPKIALDFHSFANFTTMLGTQCVTRKGYRTIGGVTMNNVADCANACRAEPMCTGFNLMITSTSGPSGNGCITKNFGCISQPDWHFVFYQKLGPDGKPVFDGQNSQSARRSPLVKRGRSSGRGNAESNSTCFFGRKVSTRLYDGFVGYHATKCTGGPSRLIGFGNEAKTCARICARNSDCFGINVNVVNGNCEAHSFGCQQVTYPGYNFYERRTTAPDNFTQTINYPQERVCVTVIPSWVSSNRERIRVSIEFTSARCQNLAIVPKKACHSDCNVTKTFYGLASVTMDPSGRWMKLYNASVAINGEYFIRCPYENFEYPLKIAVGVEPYIVSVTAVVTHSNAQTEELRVYKMSRSPSLDSANLPDIFSIVATGRDAEDGGMLIIRLKRNDTITLAFIVETGFDPIALNSDHFEMQFLSEIHIDEETDETEHLTSNSELQRTIKQNYLIAASSIARAKTCELTGVAIARLLPGRDDRDIVMMKFAYDPVITDISLNISIITGGPLSVITDCGCAFTCHASVCPGELSKSVQYEWGLSNTTLMESAIIKGQYLYLNPAICKEMLRNPGSLGISCSVSMKDHGKDRSYFDTFVKRISELKSNLSSFNECKESIIDSQPSTSVLAHAEPILQIAKTSFSDDRAQNMTVNVTCDQAQNSNCSCSLKCLLNPLSTCRHSYQWAFYDSTLVSQPANFRSGNIAAKPQEMFFNSTIYSAILRRFADVPFLQHSFKVVCRVKNLPNPTNLNDDCNDSASSTVVHEESLYRLIARNLLQTETQNVHSSSYK